MVDDFESVHEEDYCRDIIMEFVHMEGQPAEQRSSVRSPFKKYTNKLKNKVIKDHIMTNRNSKESGSKSTNPNQRLLPDRPRRGLKPVSVSRTRSRMTSKHANSVKSKENLKFRSLSSDNIAPNKINDLSKPNDGMTKSPAAIRHSVDRLPTLSKFDEERIVWIKNLEDDIQFTDERRKRSVLSRQQAELVESSSPSTSPTSSDPPSSDPSTCVSIDNSPNVARKGGMPLITGSGRPNMLANIRKEEIKIGNISNLVSNTTTDLCHHPNQSQLTSMDHELSFKRPPTSSKDMKSEEYNTVAKDQDLANSRGDEEDEESILDDLTYNVIENKPSEGNHSEQQCNGENRKGMKDGACTKTDPNLNNETEYGITREAPDSASNCKDTIAIEKLEKLERLVRAQKSNLYTDCQQNAPQFEKDIDGKDQKKSAAHTNVKDIDGEVLQNSNAATSITNDEAIMESSQDEVELDIDLDHIDVTANNAENTEEEKIEDARKKRTRKKSKSSKTSLPQQDLSAECFIVSRGWQMDQSKLLRALDKIKGVNFSRVQTATTINRVVENIRPHQDAVVIHICSQELMEAAQSIISFPTTLGAGYSNVQFKYSQNGNLAMGISVVQSIATVLSRHIITAAGQNKSTQFIISLPLPMTLIPLLPPNYEITEKDIKNLCELRRSFNANLKSNLCKCPNVQCCDNENLASTLHNSALLNSVTLNVGSSAQKEDANEVIEETKIESKKLLNDNNQLTSAGMKKLARNWEIYLTMVSKGKEGQLILRRPSEESSGNTSNSNSEESNIPLGNRRMSTSGESTGSDRSLDSRAPWKPY